MQYINEIIFTLFLGWFWLGLSVVGCCLIFTSLLGMRGAHLVSIELLLSYFWTVILCVAPFMISLFGCFNFYFFLEIWLSHQWEVANFSHMRKIFCESGTAQSACRIPLVELSNSSSTWCTQHYNNQTMTACVSIRDRAFTSAVKNGELLLIIQSVIGLMCLLLIALSIYISYRILTSPVLTQSMNDVINYFLTVPIAGCFSIATYMWWIQFQLKKFAWLPQLILGIGVAQVVALPLGIISGRLKSRFLLSCYIVLVSIIAFGFIGAGVSSIIFAGYILGVDFKSTTQLKNSIGCRKNLAGCVPNCDIHAKEDQCAAWATKDVLTLLSLDFRLTGVVQFVSLLFMIGALIVAGIFRTSLKNYKSDFI
eukprot:gene11503-15409_t